MSFAQKGHETVINHGALLGLGLAGPHPGARPRGGAHCQVSAGWARGPGSAKMNIKSTPVVDPLPAKSAVEEFSVVSVSSGGLGTWQSDP